MERTAYYARGSSLEPLCYFGESVCAVCECVGGGHARACARASGHVRVRVRVCACACAYACVRVCVCMCMCASTLGRHLSNLADFNLATRK
eukprot:6189822-Pleurochrysis_carterae.AAC.1